MTESVFDGSMYLHEILSALASHSCLVPWWSYEKAARGKAQIRREQMTAKPRESDAASRSRSVVRIPSLRRTKNEASNATLRKLVVYVVAQVVCDKALPQV